MPAAIPELEPHCGSWIVSSRATGAAVCEVYTRSVLLAVNLEKYQIETAAQYLARLNREVDKVAD